MKMTDKEIQVYTAVFQLAKQGKDLNALRVQDIADACNMGKGTLYEYFNSKEEILGKTVDYFFLVEIESIKKMIAVDEPFDLKIENFMLSILRRNEKYSSLEVLVAHSGKLNGFCQRKKSKEKMNTLVVVLIDILDELIEVGIKQNVYSENEDKEYLRFVLLSAFSGLIACMKVSENPLKDPTINKAIKHAMKMITRK